MTQRGVGPTASRVRPAAPRLGERVLGGWRGTCNGNGCAGAL
ncbi:MAG: hypothetical protein RL721_1708, partial [Candidatus Eisenbacteria bacterium]